MWLGRGHARVVDFDAERVYCRALLRAEDDDDDDEMGLMRSHHRRKRW